MTAERLDSKSAFFEGLANLASSVRGATERVIQELIQKETEGKLQVFFSEVPIWRVARRNDGTAVLFLPKEKKLSDMTPDELAPILVDTVAITRGLSGPQLHEMKKLREKLEEELGDRLLKL